ncbi:MAG: hypothetical protein HQL14_02945 [Candidatus Omnitrophica bacterium]|nr:hypothetical protein [Candidatus Omnitrophota bacterium]
MSRFFTGFFIIFIIVLNILRFYSLDSIPHGYHVDEYAAAVSMQCLAHEGTGPWGKKDNIFLQQGFGTPKPPTYTFPALLWTKVFGYKVASLRAFSVFAIVVGVLGLFILGNMIGGFKAGLWTALAASVSPWSWVLGRLAFESFFAPVCIVWGLWFFSKARGRWKDGWAGLCFCASAYFYPPARAFIPLFLISLCAYEILISRRPHRWWLLIAALMIPAIPLIKAQLAGELSFRLNEVVIWDHGYLASIGRSGNILDLCQVFLNNYLKHLDPRFLFLKGDPDFSHSTQNIGLLSWLDIAAWGILAIGLLCWKVESVREVNPWRIYGKWLGASWFCFLLGIVPSALTHLDVPNALRMCLAWPFLCLITGLTISCVSQRFVLVTFLMGSLLLGDTVLFINDYFRYYPERSKGMFSYWIYDEAQTLKTPQQWLNFLVKYHVQDYHERYFLMNNLGQGCAQSYEAWKNIGVIIDRLNLKNR